MIALRRWIKVLLLYHAILATGFVLWWNFQSMPHWMGSLVAFGLPTVQFTWSLTVGIILGPSRQNRPWFWTTLLLSFIPLTFVRIACFLAYYFLGLSVALTVLAFCLTILLAQTVAGIYCGIMAHHTLRKD